MSHDDILERFVIGTNFRILNRSDHLVSSGHTAKDRVLIVEPRGRGCSDEKLRRCQVGIMEGDEQRTCEPLVLGPAFAIETVKGRSCLERDQNSRKTKDKTSDFGGIHRQIRLPKYFHHQSHHATDRQSADDQERKSEEVVT